MKKEDAFYIGYFPKTKGLKGELQLFFEFDDYEELDFDVLFVEDAGKLVPYFVENLKIQTNQTAKVFLEDIDHIDKASPLVKKKVYLPLTQMPERDPEDFRYTDLVGFLVVDEEAGELGEITQVQELPQQFIATFVYQEKEVMFPLNEDIILEIDVENEELVVDLPEGLLDLYLSN
ncbi:MAG: 16S rRNA processing protein RimM [Pedobacter sp.]|nr:MAG: 16S rRNA processing protein RimM [Pedobacter sp.]